MMKQITVQVETMPLLIEVPYNEEVSLGDAQRGVFWAVTVWGKNRKECFQRLRMMSVSHFMFTGLNNNDVTMFGGREI